MWRHRLVGRQVRGRPLAVPGAEGEQVVVLRRGRGAGERLASQPTQRRPRVWLTAAAGARALEKGVRVPGGTVCVQLFFPSEDGRPRARKALSRFPASPCGNPPGFALIYCSQWGNSSTPGMQATALVAPADTVTSPSRQPRTAQLCRRPSWWRAPSPCALAGDGGPRRSRPFCGGVA